MLRSVRLHRAEAGNAVDTRRGQREPLSVSWEIETVEGKEGKARSQAEVMVEALTWIISHMQSPPR